MNELHLFAGAGGGILGGMLLGHTTVCAVEIEPYCRKILLQRQRDNILPKFPIWDDVTTFDGNPWRGKVDIVAGGFPCPDFSNANQSDTRMHGIKGKRGGLWNDMFRIVCEIQPRIVFVENVPNLLKLGIGDVLGDLAASGYNAAWCVLGSRDCGGVHKRNRLWILAINSNVNGIQKEQPIHANVGKKKAKKKKSRHSIGAIGMDGVQRYIESHICRKNDEIPNFMDRFKAVGNAQDPIVASTAFKILLESLTK